MSNGIAVVLTEKTFFKKALLAHVVNGGGYVNLGEGIGIKFVATSEDYVKLQICTSGIGKTPDNQSWQKTVQKKQYKKKIYDPDESKVKDKVQVEEI